MAVALHLSSALPLTQNRPNTMKLQLLRLIGFNPSITRKMDEASIGSLLFGFLTILVVATVSAALFATTFSRLCFGGEHYWMLFSIWALLIWILDTVVIHSLGSKWVVSIRLAIVGVIALVNSLTFDELLFHRDIHNFLKREHQAEVEKVEGQAYQADYQRIRTERGALTSRNIELEQDVEASRKDVLREWLGEAESGEEGQGWRYEAKNASHKTDSAMKYTERATNLVWIGQLDSTLTALEEKKQQRLQAIVKPEESGLRDNVNALHRLVFGPDGKPMDKLYFILLFGLGIILEALALIVKPRIKGAVTSYHAIATETAEKATERAIDGIRGDGLVDNLSDTLTRQQRTNELTSKINKAVSDQKASTSVDEIEGRVRKAVLEDDVIAEAILATQRRNEAMKGAFGGPIYEVFGQELNDLELAAIKQELERLSRQRHKNTVKEEAL